MRNIALFWVKVDKLSCLLCRQHTCLFTSVIWITGDNVSHSIRYPYTLPVIQYQQQYSLESLQFNSKVYFEVS